MKKNNLIRFAILSVVFLLSACGGTGELTVSDPWSRPALAGGNGAVYFVIENDSGVDDVLLSVTSNAAAAVEMHNVILVDPNAMEHDEPHNDEAHAEHMADPEHEHDEDHDDGEHQHTDEDTSENMSDMTTDDMLMQMSPQEDVPVANGETVTFEPGGYHVMLIGLTQELKEGDVITVTLNFKHAGSITVEAVVEFR